MLPTATTKTRRSLPRRDRRTPENSVVIARDPTMHSRSSTATTAPIRREPATPGRARIRTPEKATSVAMGPNPTRDAVSRPRMRADPSRGRRASREGSSVSSVPIPSSGRKSQPRKKLSKTSGTTSACDRLARSRPRVTTASQNHAKALKPMPSLRSQFERRPFRSSVSFSRRKCRAIRGPSRTPARRRPAGRRRRRARYPPGRRRCGPRRRAGPGA